MAGADVGVLVVPPNDVDGLLLEVTELPGTVSTTLSATEVVVPGVVPAASAEVGICTVGRITWLRTCDTAPHARPMATTAASNHPTASFNQLVTIEVSH